MGTILVIAAVSVVVGIVAVDLVKSSRLRKRLRAGAPVPTSFDRTAETSTNYAVLHQQANAAHNAGIHLP